MLRAIIYFHVNIILNVPIKYRNASVFCQSECACVHKTVNMVGFFVKSKDNTYPKRESTYTNVQSCPYNQKRELKCWFTFNSKMLITKEMSSLIDWTFKLKLEIKLSVRYLFDLCAMSTRHFMM